MRTSVLVPLPLALVTLASCAPSRPAAPVAPTSAAAAAPRAAPAPAPPATAPARARGAFVPIVDELVAAVRRHHVFFEGHAAVFEGSLPRLRAEAAAAETDAEGMVAIAHLQRSLRDRHCHLSPPAGVRAARLGLGLSLHTEREPGGRVRVRVEAIKDPGLEGRVKVGDELLTVDGAPVEAWLADHPFESSAANPAVHLAETANAIVTQIAPWTITKEGDLRRLGLAAAGELALPFRRPFRYERAESAPDIDAAPPMASVSCTEDGKVPYAGYELASLGVNYCTYRPKGGDAARAGTRIVRFLSFMYPASDPAAQLRWVRVDHDGLARDLAGAKRVILDIHENHGGNNPFVFLSWFAGKPWQHQRVSVRTSPDFGEEEVRQLLFGNGALTRRYLEAAKRGDAWLSYPFLCDGDACDGPRGPRPAERVTQAPVAVVTGPECTSSCDAIAAIWSAYGMGPIVGKQPMHGFTTVRRELPVRGPDGKSLGLFRIALSSEALPGRPALEGAPIRLDWEAPETFATRETWLDAAVAEATSRLGAERRTPITSR